MLQLRMRHSRFDGANGGRPKKLLTQVRPWGSAGEELPGTGAGLGLGLLVLVAGMMPSHPCARALRAGVGPRSYV